MKADFVAFLLAAFLCLLAVGGASSMASEGPVVINTPSGRLRGERFLLADGSKGLRFLGVPYARPPTGSLRFAAPVEARPWSGVLDARKFGAMCYQPLENDVWDTVESPLDLGHLEAQLRKALAAELGSDLYEEEVEELEDELRKVAEARENEERARKAEGDCTLVVEGGEGRAKCGGGGGGGAEEEEEEVEVEVDFHVEEEQEQEVEEEVVEEEEGKNSEVFRTSVSDSDVARGGSDADRQRRSEGHTREELHVTENTVLLRRIRQLCFGNETSPSSASASTSPSDPRTRTSRSTHEKSDSLVREKGIREQESAEESAKDAKNIGGGGGGGGGGGVSAGGGGGGGKEGKGSESPGDPKKEEEKRERGKKDKYLYMQQKHMREYTMSEDCLTLNIYTPLPEGRRAKNTSSSSLPVLVYIHGGSFYSNGGRLYPGEKLASEGIIVVTINYRLGPFGFLSTGDANSRGNWGLLDQRMALLWVRRHASSFGGHKDKLLLVGNSAGAASVILHLVSPLSQDLFSRAAALSGCALAPWSLQRRPLHFAQKLAAGMRCPVSPSSELVDCLRRQDAKEINQIYAKKNIQDGLWLAFAPVVEGNFAGAFLPRPPRTLLEEGSLPPIPLIMTLTKDEVSIWFRDENRTIELSRAEEWMDLLMKQKFPDLEPRALAAVLHAVRAAYIYRNGFTTNTTSKVPMKIISELISDLGLRVPCVEEARLLSHWTRLYFAEFSYVSPDDVRVGSQKWIGSYHESDLQFIFGQPFLGLANTLRGPHDQSVATTIMRLIISFAHTGVPELIGMDWPAYNRSHLVHLEMSEKLSLSHNLVQHSLCFWQRFIPLMTLFPMKPLEEETSVATPIATPPLFLLLLVPFLHRAFS